MNQHRSSIKVFTGNANPELAAGIARHMRIPLGKANVSTFSDGEICCEIQESVRGHDVFIIQPLSRPVNNHLMELLIMIDAAKRASAERITAVVPYYGYARQDRKVHPRDPITAKLVADLITTAGATRLLTMDLHAAQVQGYQHPRGSHFGRADFGGALSGAALRRGRPGGRFARFGQRFARAPVCQPPERPAGHCG